MTAAADTDTSYLGTHGLLSHHTSTGSVFYEFDLQGSVAQRLDANQNVLTTLVFDAYGTELAGGSTGEPWGYGAQAGYYTDGETGLIRCTHRYYDPGAGRWLNRDPIGVAGGVNLYAYVGNGPVEGLDPLGLFSYSVGPHDHPWLVFDNDSVCSGLTQGFTDGRILSGFIADIPIPALQQVGQIGSSVCAAGSLAMGAIQGNGDAGTNSFIVPPGGPAVRVPDGWPTRTADNGKGIVCQDPNATTDNGNMIRVMDPNPSNPKGYVRTYNSGGQPVDPVGCKPLGRADTHIPLDNDGLVNYPSTIP